MSEVYADLVGTTCQQPDFEQAEVRRFFQHPDAGYGLRAVFAYRNPALAPGVDVLVERLSQLARAALPGASHDGKVDLFHLPVAQHPVELDERATLLRHH